MNLAPPTFPWISEGNWITRRWSPASTNNSDPPLYWNFLETEDQINISHTRSWKYTQTNSLLILELIIKGRRMEKSWERNEMNVLGRVWSPSCRNPAREGLHSFSPDQTLPVVLSFYGSRAHKEDFGRLRFLCWAKLHPSLEQSRTRNVERKPEATGKSFLWFSLLNLCSRVEKRHLLRQRSEIRLESHNPNSVAHSSPIFGHSGS